MKLSTDKTERKESPIARGVLDYFPNAIAEVAHVSLVGNRQHNPGEPMHWARGKSDDHADCVARHLIERGRLDEDGLRHSAKAAWRALAMLQVEIEADVRPFPIDLKEHERHTCGDERVSGPCKVCPPPPPPPDQLGDLVRLGCPQAIAKMIVGGSMTTTKNAGVTDWAYVAGPMRGCPNFNFPAFDAARNALLHAGFNVISPADIDRACNPDADNPDKVETSDQTLFVLRDFWSIFFIAKQGRRGAIALLPGWEKSVGAAGEFFLARWLKLNFFRVIHGKTDRHPTHLHPVTDLHFLITDFCCGNQP